MPELPEVETARRAAAAVAVGRRITGVTVLDDPLVFEGDTPVRIRRALLGRRVRAVRRHGKHLWFEFDRRPWLCAHFGMAGGLSTSRRRTVRLMSGHGRRASGWPPRFTRLLLELDDGGALAIADGRRLGRIRLRRDPSAEPPIAGLGFDALRGLPGAEQFRALARGRGAPIKALLLDQSFAAGVGNWIADEVLFQARIAPRRPARSLSDAELDRLRDRLRAVVRTAVRVGADSKRFPRRWLFHRRWRRWRRRPGVTVAGDAIRWETIGGRTTAWVPAVQR
jgi:formamidopyrimidine-DNA glycosylase